MPPVSQQQRRAMYAAAAGKSKLGIPRGVGQEFVQAGHGVTGLPMRSGAKHDTAPRGGFAHQGSTVEGPTLSRGTTAGPTVTTGTPQGAAAFRNAGTMRPGPTRGAAATTGPTASRQPVAREGAKAFKNAGSTREGYYTTHCVTDAQAAPAAGASVTRPRIRRKTTTAHSGGSPEGFRTNTRPAREDRATAAGHHGTEQTEQQARDVPGPYIAGRRNQDSPTQKVGVTPSPAPAPPGRRGPNAFKLTEAQQQAARPPRFAIRLRNGAH